MLVKPVDLLGWHFNVVWLLLHLPAVTASHGRALPQHSVFTDMSSHPVCPPLVYIGLQRGILTIFMELAARIELASFPYQGNIIPLYYASVVPTRGVEPLFRPCRERGLPLADAGSGRLDSNQQLLPPQGSGVTRFPYAPCLLRKYSCQNFHHFSIPNERVTSAHIKRRGWCIKPTYLIAILYLA